jgi:hypothetical protein
LARRRPGSPVSDITSLNIGLHTRISSDTVRLLRLSWANKLQGDFLIVRLAECPTFTAVSYYWGEEQGDDIGFPCGHSLSLSRNLSLALRSLTYGSEADPLLLWIDQICINQDDLDERKHQVGMMNEIFSKADEVMAWLGGEVEIENVLQSSWAVECLLKLKCREKPSVALIQDFLIQQAERALILKIAGSPDDVSPQGLLLAEQGFYGLLSLWCCPWFERLWVRQEVALAKRVTFRCGNKDLSLEELARACEMQSEAAHAFFFHRKRW